MEEVFWHNKWQQQEIGFHQQEVNPFLQRYWSDFGVPPSARVFVPLCGKSGDMTWLRQQGYGIFGVELSPLAVSAYFEENQIKADVSDHGPFRRHHCDQVELWCGNFFDLEAGDLAGIAAVYDRASLIALPLQFRERYARHMADILPSGTGVLLVTLEYPDEQMEGPPFSVTEAEVRRLFGEDFTVQPLGKQEILQHNQHFIDKGLTRLSENCYRLRRC